MRLPPLRIVQKISGAIIILNICITLVLTLVFGSIVTKNTYKTSADLLLAVSQSIEGMLKQYHATFIKLKQDHPNSENLDSDELWHDILEAALSNLPRNIEAVLLDRNGNIVAPASMKGAISPQMREVALKHAKVRHVGTTETPRGTVTGISYELWDKKYILAVYYFHANIENQLSKRKLLLFLATGIIVFMGMLLAWILSRHFAKPLQCLNDAAVLIPSLDLEEDNIWQKLPKLPLERQDEIGTLAKSFQYMTYKIQKNVQETLKLTVEKEKNAGELRLSRSIQESILPKDFLPQGFVSNITTPNPFVHGLVLPAREVGGDLFDAFWLDEEHFCFAIGDVSDKGVPAALFMSITMTLIRSQVSHVENWNNPASVLEYINNYLCKDNTSNMFVTLIVGILHCKSGKLIFANAGHAPPICMDNQGSLKVLPTHKEMVIASFDDIDYTNVEYTLKANERVFLYTDGVNEAINAQGQRLGDIALHNILHAGATLDPKALNEFIVEQIKIFSGDAPQYDDITLLNFLWHKPKT